ncbi:MAG: plasmid pRiA4b ORF-3 family protein [Clostridia bacterium]|nr:plasmid pRiA4b ORF-3 family protein [Clostridia bacterium]
MNNYTATEKDIQRTISDFEIFCKYLEDNRPKLTKTREELGKKDCYAINALLSRPRDFDGPKYMQPLYPTINLFFHIIMQTGLFTIDYGKSDSLYLMATPKLENYRKLNPFNRYLLLFKTYWTQIDFDKLYAGTLISFRDFKNIERAFELIANAEPKVRISANFEDYSHGLDHANPIHNLFLWIGLIVHHLRDFNFWEYEETHIPKFNSTKKDIQVKSVTPTSLGIAMINACRSRPYEKYNEKYNEGWDEGYIEVSWSDTQIRPIFREMVSTQSLSTKNKEPFEKAFEPIFPNNAIDGNAIIKVLESEAKNNPVYNGNTYIFKVWLRKNLWRRIKLSSVHTLQHLHDAIQDAFDFHNDHLYAFFMDGKPWSKDVYWDKKADEKPTADKAVIGKLGLVPGKRLLYLFDFGDEWQFNVQLEEVMDSKTVPIKAEVIDKKGDSPEQYPSWED